MPLISGTIPNLINGISQQPASLRLKTQAELQVNGLSTVVDGLRKRPSSEHVARLMGVGAADGAFIHTIRRDENEFYILVITNDGTIRVFDQYGVERTVTGSTSYFNNVQTAATDITATSVADYTFIVNKNQTVTKGSALSATRPKEAMIYCRQGDYLTDYEIKITANGFTFIYTYTTKDASVAANQEDVKTNKIITQLDSQMASLPNYFSREVIGSTIYLQRTDGGDFEIEASDSRGDTFLKAFKGQTRDFTALPPKGKLGFTIKIVGNAKDEEDDYYVSLQDPEGNGQYVWRETLAGGITTDFEVGSMPHQLISNADGTFTFQQAPWEPRTAGDDLTNPFPSFTDQKISDIFLYRNRLGFLSGENVIFSEAGEYYNFFAKTVLTLLDTNPIDVAVSNNQVSYLRHAVPFAQSLLLFSDLTQFNVESGETLTPSTISIDVATQFECSLRARPQGSGRFVFFATRKGQWSGIREYFVEDSTNNTTNALEVTAHVPRYLSGEITKLCASSNEDTLLALTEDEPNRLYVYRYFWSQESKLQSAWSHWEFDGRIINADFNKSDIYIIIERDDGVFLEVINLSRDTSTQETSGNFSIHLDRRVKYGYGGETTMPYIDPNAIFVDKDGKQLDITPNSAEATQLGNDLAAAQDFVYCGIPFDFRYQFSEVVIKEDNEPITIGRLQLRKMAVVFNETGYFEVVVTPEHRDPSIIDFTARYIGSNKNIIGKVPIESGTLQVPVLGKSDGISVEIRSSSHLPVTLQSAEWEGYYTLRSTRQ